MLLVLAVGAAVVWVSVVKDETATAVDTRCPPPGPAQDGRPAPQPTGQHLEQNELDGTAAMPPAQAAVRVLNGSTQRGKAALVTENLRQLGFGQMGEPSEDPLYPGKDLDCTGQIRFGQQGASTARTLSFLQPCAELVRDDRQDASVDLAIGSEFDDLSQKVEARQLIQQITEWGVQHPVESGGLQAEGKAGPAIDPGLVEVIRKHAC